jgi:hypothetical protein
MHVWTGLNPKCSMHNDLRGRCGDEWPDQATCNRTGFSYPPVLDRRRRERWDEHGRGCRRHTVASEGPAGRESRRLGDWQWQLIQTLPRAAAAAAAWIWILECLPFSDVTAAGFSSFKSARSVLAKGVRFGEDTKAAPGRRPMTMHRRRHIRCSTVPIFFASDPHCTTLMYQHVPAPVSPQRVVCCSIIACQHVRPYYHRNSPCMLSSPCTTLFVSSGHNKIIHHLLSCSVTLKCNTHLMAPQLF